MSNWTPYFGVNEEPDERDYMSDDEAAENARRIVVDNGGITKADNPDISLRLAGNTVCFFTPTFGGGLDAKHLDDMIALLNAAKHELARRKEAAR